MLVDDVILFVLFSLVIPLALAVFYHLTKPVPGRGVLRQPVRVSDLAPVSRILVAQKISLILIVSFIAIVRYTGGFPGREWVAFGLYLLLVAVAWTMFAYQRHIQLPFEREARGK
jgi:hypothetical protein